MNMVYIVYAYNDYYPDPADRQIKGVFTNQASADDFLQEFKAQDSHQHVEVSVFRVRDQ